MSLEEEKHKYSNAEEPHEFVAKEDGIFCDRCGFQRKPHETDCVDYKPYVALKREDQELILCANCMSFGHAHKPQINNETGVHPVYGRHI